MKLKHNTVTAFSIAGVTAMFVAAAVWATPPKSSSTHAGCPDKTLTTETAGGGSAGAGRAAP